MMIGKVIFNLIETGTSNALLSNSRKRNIVITNVASLVLFVGSAGLSLLESLLYGEVGYELMLVSAASIAPLLLNALGLANIGRLLLNTQYPIIFVGFSIYTKLVKRLDVNVEDFYEFRILLTGFSVLPLLTCSLRERWLLFFSLLVNVTSLIFFDPLHEIFDVGFYDVGLQSEEYYLKANIFPLYSGLLILGGITLLKYFNARYEYLTNRLNSKLRKSNRLLTEDKREIQVKNSAIAAQSAELVASQELLLKAKDVIEDQKKKLQKTNNKLVRALVAKNNELTQANSELTKFNEELRQFSYTVSHNLRGPVARILGLTHLFEVDEEATTSELQDIAQRIKKASHELDDIISDLSRITDIRNSMYKINERVDLDQEWRLAGKALEASIDHSMVIRTDFTEAPYFFTIRPIISNILYNLLSNSIKYRHPRRPLEIHVKSMPVNDRILMTFKDNGLGIDLRQFGKDMFSMYKRFHTHVDGKGLGLYMIKNQIESIGGSISVASNLNEGTIFTLTFKNSVKTEGQIFFDSNFARLLYNARLNTATLVWKRTTTSSEYREAFLKCLEMLKSYHTPAWLIDARKQSGNVNDENRNWLFNKVIPQAAKDGLLRCAQICNQSELDTSSRPLIKEELAMLNIDIVCFSNLVQATNWLESRDEAGRYLHLSKKLQE